MKLKKFFKRLWKYIKHNFASIIFALILIAILACGIFAIYYICKSLYSEVVGNEDAIVGAVTGGISFLGTMILGIIAYWQTRSANQISQLLSQRQMISDIRFLGNGEMTVVDLPSKRLIDFSEKHETEGLLCSTEDIGVLKTRDSNDKYLEITFYFKLENESAAIENLFIDEVYFNKSFQNDPTYKQFYLNFKIINSKGKVPFSYNAVKDSYSLKIYLNCKESFLTKINNYDCFVIDFTLLTESNYRVKLETKYNINLQRVIDLDALLNGNKKSVQIKLENITTHRGEIQYG